MGIASTSDCGLYPAQFSQEEDENDGSECGHDNPPEQPVSRKTDETEQESPDKRTEDTDDHIYKDAFSGAMHHQAGEPARDQSDHQGVKKFHDAIHDCSELYNDTMGRRPSPLFCIGI